MIEYFSGTVFNAPAEALVNTVNTVGVMGAGIALEFALRYPKMLGYYQQKCKSHLMHTGFVDYYVSEEKTIVLFPTKQHFKYPSKIEWIEQGLKSFVATYKRHSFKSIAFPKLGTLNGGLQWEEVKSLMDKYLSPLDISVIICLDELKYAQGKEEEMLAVLNGMEIEEFANIVRLTYEQKEALQKALPLDRFWKLQKLPKIGITTYTKLFNHCYQKNIGEKQLSMNFD